MIVCGIIAEFNPFHNGHAYLLDAARKITNADYIIVVMSGDYVQRGEPACMDKYSRTKAALSAGADAVFELPVCISTGSAQYFARGAVAALDALGVINYLCFGSESGDIKELYKKAESEEETISKDLPNNILAVEYLKALNHFHSSIEPVTIKRQGNDYHDTTLHKDTFCSAAAVRQILEKQLQDSDDKNTGAALTGLVPDSSVIVMCEYYKTHRFMSFDSLSDLLFYKLITDQNKDMTDYFDIYGDLSNKIRTALSGIRPASASEFRSILKSKDIAFSHISRALLHIVLGIQKFDVKLLQQYDYCAYLRPLGYRRNSDGLRKAVKTQANRPILSKLADASGILNEEQLALLKKDIYASELYQQLSIIEKKAARIPGEYRQPMVWYDI